MRPRRSHSAARRALESDPPIALGCTNRSWTRPRACDDLGSIHTGMRGADARPIIPLRETPGVKGGAHTPPISSGAATTVVRAVTARAVHSVATVGTRRMRVPKVERSAGLGGSIPMKLKPLGDRLIVRAVEEDETTV